MTDKLLEHLDKYITSMKNEVPGLISVSVIEIATGRTFVNAKENAVSDVTELNKLQTSAVKYALKGLEHIHDSNTKRLEDIIITLGDQTHIIITSELQSFMSYIIIDAKAGNIALTQTLHKKYYSQAVTELVKEFGEENIKNHPFFQPKDLTIEKKEEEKQKQKRSSFLHDLFFN